MPQEFISLMQKIYENGLLNWIGLILLSAWAGATRYLSSLNGKKIDIKELFIEIFTSGFVGIITALVCYHYELPIYITGAITGISANYGTKSLNIIGEFLKKSVNVKPGAEPRELPTVLNRKKEN